MKWEILQHGLTDPDWAWGMATQARRATEASLPWITRFAPAIFSGVLSAMVAGGSAFWGTWAAMGEQIESLRREDVRLNGVINERTSLRQQQMSEFQKACAETQARVALLESRWLDTDRTLARIEALTSQHLQLLGRRK